MTDITEVLTEISKIQSSSEIPPICNLQTWLDTSTVPNTAKTSYGGHWWSEKDADEYFEDTLNELL